MFNPKSIRKRTFTGNKLSSYFNINDKTKFERRHDVIYLGTCPETTCNDKRRIFESVKNNNGRDFKSHLLKHALQNSHQLVSKKDFKIIVMIFEVTIRKGK